MCYDIPLDQVSEIGDMVHDKKGVGFSFVAPAVVGNMVPWSAASFITHIRLDAMKQMGLQEHGVRRLFCLPFPGSVDKMRINAARVLGVTFVGPDPPPVWVFVLICGDGARFSIHPQHKGCKASCSQLDQPGLDARQQKMGTEHGDSHRTGVASILQQHYRPRWFVRPVAFQPEHRLVVALPATASTRHKRRRTVVTIQPTMRHTFCDGYQLYDIILPHTSDTGGHTNIIDFATDECGNTR